MVNRCFAREPLKVHHLGTSGARACIYAGRPCHAIDAAHSKQLDLFSINSVEDLSNSRSNQVMADIVGKYASKEGELSARLRKKYGHPLPSEVSVQDLRRVLAKFGLEDKDFPESCEQETLSSNKTPASHTGYEQLEAPRPAGSEATERPHVGTGHQESPSGGSALDFRSKYFDPLQVRNGHLGTASSEA